MTPTLLQPFLWFAYWLIQGFFFTGKRSIPLEHALENAFTPLRSTDTQKGVWVIGHECGHRAYSESNAVNDTVGLILHSALLVPYHSWRLTHGAHHMYTGHLGKDTVHVPPSRSHIPHWQEVISDTPIAAMVDGLQILVALTFGWPGYLMFNISGQVYPTRANHFEPGSPMFKPKDRRDILVSDAALLVALSLIALASANYGFSTVVCYWGIPYLWTNMWLVLITYLHHTHKTLPKYRKFSHFPPWHC
jgi:omega-6 fatty acid desaturase (delta-12 desaturase)